MPDTDPPWATRVQEDVRIMFSKDTPGQTLLRRKWSCPGDQTIAVYVDGALGSIMKAWIEFHLSGCLRCRLVVADVVKAQRKSDLPPPAADVIRKATILVERRSAHRRGIWAPAGALAVLTLLAASIVVFRKPASMLVQSPPAPSAPLVAKSQPLAPSPTRALDVVRKPRTPELLPKVLFPEADSVMSGDRLQFRWKPVPQSRNYQVQVVRSDGDLVWAGQTDKSALQFPPDVTVQGGSYFVWITAYLQDGRTVKSAPVRFVVKR